MDWFHIVKRHYEAGRYNTAEVAVFVAAGKLTPEQYQTDGFFIAQLRKKA